LNTTTSSARTPFLRSGLLALISARRGGGGSGARSEGRGGRASLLKLGGLLALAIVALLALGAGSASAAPPAEFGEAGSGAGQIAGQSTGIAVDQSSSEVWINDGFNSRADRFGSEGAFRLSFGWGVADGTTQALQTCGPLATPPTAGCTGGIIGFSPGPGQFGLGPSGAAADSSGVYFHDSPARITKFGPLGEFLWMIGGGVDQGGGTPANPGNLCTAQFLADGDICGEAHPGPGPGEFEVLGTAPLAVGPSGTLYVGDSERIQKFSPAGAFEGQVALPGVLAERIAVDSSGDIYVAAAGLTGVHKYDPTDTELGTPRDTAAPSNATIAIGPSDQLLVDHPQSRRLETYDAAGEQLLSIPAGGSFEGGIAYGATIERLYGLDAG
jgi:hypothetical protein